MNISSQEAENLIQGLNTDIFQVETQSTANDRLSFLRVQKAVRTTVDTYVYLEVGSHVGGTLCPHLFDPVCVSAVSVDPRPLTQPDERAEIFHYDDNSTERMIATLSHVLSEQDLTRLKTIETDVSDVRSEDLSDKATLALIDGEHTVKACFSDFLAVLSLVKPDSIITFHDANLIFDAILNAERYLVHAGVEHEVAFLPDTVGLIGLGQFARTVRRDILPYTLDREAFIEASRERLIAHIAQLHAPQNDDEKRLSEAHRQLIVELKAVKEAARAAEQRFTEISNSTIWRALAPARQLADGLKRAFGSSSGN